MPCGGGSRLIWSTVCAPICTLGRSSREMENIPKHFIEHLVQNERKTYLEISSILCTLYPGVRGLSERSVRRFCLENSISTRSQIDDNSLDVMVKEVITKVGPTWGRKMVTGYLRSKGMTPGEQRVGSSLARVAPCHQEMRKNRAEQLKNPIPYSAQYFGHKLHVDQNEKLAMYGVTHVCAVDGYSGKIISHSLMPVKNNLIIYNDIYRNSVATFGLWDQLRVDHGKEFYLMLFVQDLLSKHRRNTERLPYIQSTSKENHKIERIWVEFNLRVNYPVKRALNEMAGNDVFDMEDGITKFSISWVSLRVCKEGCRQVIDSWNAHHIQGSGRPNELEAANNMTAPIAIRELPSTEEVVQMYEQKGGHLTYWPEFGCDPLSFSPGLSQRRMNMFSSHFPDMGVIFYNVVNNCPAMFQRAIILFREITIYLLSHP